MGVRQSRRLAQIKIKEQVDPKKPEPKSHKQEKLKKNSEVVSVCIRIFFAYYNKERDLMEERGYTDYYFWFITKLNNEKLSPNSF